MLFRSDNVYLSTPVAADGVYRITGYRGTRHIVDMSVVGGTLTPFGIGKLGPAFASYDIDKLKLTDFKTEVLFDLVDRGQYRRR